MRAGVFASLVYWGPAQREQVRHRARVEELIEFLKLEDIRKQPAGALPYGLRKRVELGRALALDPKLLLLDEPMGGMNQEEKEDVARFILDINSQWGTTIILIEHDMGVVMDISHRVAVLDNGRNIAEGSPQQVQNNPDVIRAYLGAGRARQGEAA
jgi:branched-chain amino acid transport system ATP-binding protein